jgi:hypothetical protein
VRRIQLAVHQKFPAVLQNCLGNSNGVLDRFKTQAIYSKIASLTQKWLGKDRQHSPYEIVKAKYNQSGAVNIHYTLGKEQQSICGDCRAMSNYF